MTDLKPRKVVVDDSPSALEEAAGREDAYKSIGGDQRKAVDEFIEARNTRAKDLIDAEKEISEVLKKFNKGLDKEVKMVDTLCRLCRYVGPC